MEADESKTDAHEYFGRIIDWHTVTDRELAILQRHGKTPAIRAAAKTEQERRIHATQTANRHRHNRLC
jgi:hypothetical protein